MKSKISYERLKHDLEIKKHQVYDYVEQVNQIQECLLVWKPDLVIVDKNSNLKDITNSLFFEFGKFCIEFNSSFDEVLEEVNEYSLLIQSDEEVELIEEDTPDFSIYEEQVNKKIERQEKIVVQIQKEYIEKEVEKISIANLPSKLIIVCSLWSSSGSTFFGTSLGRVIAERGVNVSYIEHPLIRPYLFDYLNIANEEGLKYLDLAHLIKSKKNAKYEAFKKRGINWIVNDPRLEKIKNWTYEDTLKIIYSQNSPINILDISTCWKDKEILNILYQADYIYLCLEPDVVKINYLCEGQEEHKFLDFLMQLEQEENIDFQIISTKMNENIDRKKWRESFPKKPKTELSYIPYSEFCKSAWQSTFIYDDDSHKEVLEQDLEPIIKEILPKKFHFLEKKERENKFISLFKRNK